MDINEIVAQAAAKIDAVRDKTVDAVRTAAASGVELREAAKMLASAERKYAKDYALALRAGWSESDLRSFGIEAPSQEASGRPRDAKSRRQGTVQTESIGGDSPASE